LGIVNVVCAILERGDTFLAARRARTLSQGGLWELPGGKVREGEDPREALAREIAEELGVRVEIGGQCGSTVHDYGPKTVALTAYRCTIVEGTLRAAEHEQIRWVTPRQAKRLTWSAADIPILNTYLDSHPQTAEPSQYQARQST
jgi:8-oxo-dGTP diphosphatase